MSLIAVGVNHNSAPVAIRERVALLPPEDRRALTTLSERHNLNEIVILSTCNRTEFYCSEQQIYPVFNWLEQELNIAKTELIPHLYEYTGVKAVTHVMRVASGLDSMILGEPQILGQMKNAYTAATEVGTVDKSLHRLFQQTFKVAKTIRSNTAIGKSPVSVAYAAVKLAKHVFAELDTAKVLLVGAGEMVELAAMHFAEHQVSEICIANRNVAKAEKLAERFNAKPIPLTAIAEYLPQADIVLSCTAADLPIIGKGMAETAMKLRKHKPIVMLDIAVPRDIEPEVAQLEDIYLYNIDDLRSIIDMNQRSREQAREQAEDIIKLEANEFMYWLKQQTIVDAVSHFREQLHDIRREQIIKAQKALRRGLPADEVLENFALQLTNKILHKPTLAIKEAKLNDDNIKLALLRDLFCKD